MQTIHPTPSPTFLPLRDVIHHHQLAAKKSLGQHFLTDTNLLAKIVRSAGDLAGKHVIEIGPGPGGLTRAILASDAAQVTAIEKDPRCIAALEPLRNHYGERFTLREEDGLKINLMEMPPTPRVVVANLPYNVGTAMIIQWLEASIIHGRAALEGFTVMLQKEVGERLTAPVGTDHYGRLSVLMQALTDAEMMFDVPPSAFVPPPKVTSVIVRARILEKPRVAVPIPWLEKITGAAFGQRRKMLRQSLKILGGEALCLRADIDPTLRAEQCDLAMFERLAKAYGEAA